MWTIVGKIDIFPPKLKNLTDAKNKIVRNRSNFQAWDLNAGFTDSRTREQKRSFFSRAFYPAFFIRDPISLCENLVPGISTQNKLLSCEGQKVCRHAGRHTQKSLSSTWYEYSRLFIDHFFGVRGVVTYYYWFVEFFNQNPRVLAKFLEFFFWEMLDIFGWTRYIKER